MAPTTLYVKPMLDVLGQIEVHAMAHITGGGITENIIRVVPDGLGLAIDAGAIVLPPVFDWLKRSGNVANEEMWRTFNCGVGFTLLLDPNDVAMAKRLLAGHGLATREIGQVVAAGGGERVRIG
ncbi:MAG: phosphoribosylformylglycinamidine cyclo-ligase, partial [Xanthomonadales bacterium]|nr:phosphoribosylformylglycinamidine cyclo-ligase [Xanthomonadales bacterium]